MLDRPVSSWIGVPTKYLSAINVIDSRSAKWCVFGSVFCRIGKVYWMIGKLSLFCSEFDGLEENFSSCLNFEYARNYQNVLRWIEALMCSFIMKMDDRDLDRRAWSAALTTLYCHQQWMVSPFAKHFVKKNTDFKMANLQIKPDVPIFS